MKITSVKNEKELAVFGVEFSENEWEEILNKEILKASKNLKLPGYRPGKVPLEIAKKNINETNCFIKALNVAKEKSEEWLVDQNEFKKISDDICDFEPVESKPENKEKGKINFVISFAKFPQFKVKNTKELKADGLVTKVSKEMVDAAINQELSKNEMMAPKNGPAKKGDMVVIDFKGFVDNKAFDGGEATNYELKLGSKSFIDNFEDQLIGLKAGDSKDVNVTFPKDYHVPNLKGKKAKFEVKVNVVNEIETPKLNDEFVKSLNIKDVTTVANYKKHLEEQIQKNIDTNLDNAIQNVLSKQLVEMVPDSVKIHEKLVINVAEIFISRLMLSLIGKVVSLDEFIKLIGGGKGAITKEKLIDEEKKQAKDYIKIKFALKQYANEQKIEVTDKDMDSEIKNILANSKTKESEIRDDFSIYSSVKREVLDKKVFEFLKKEILKNIK
ncbi:MAG: trigger factor [Malacoplasma sp.]|nr:trigger factor [Malacoplasma sp.]